MADWAIFTGDIVKSRALEPGALDLIFGELTEITSEIAKWQGAPAPFTRFRGDGWQMALAPRFAFRAAMILRATVRATGKSHDTRIGIGIGGAHVGSDLARGDGPAFVASGAALDAMKRERLRADAATPLMLRTALPLADSIAGGWTVTQADVLRRLLVIQPPTQKSLGEMLGISQQTVQKHAKAAHLDALLDVSALIEGEQS